MSRDAIKIPTTIYGFKRLTNSHYGNPRYSITTEHGDFTTQSDAALNYDIDNIEHANRVALRGGEGFVAVLTTTRAHKVWGITTYGEDNA